MQATQLTVMDAMLAVPTPKGYGTPHPLAGSESFGKAWQQEMGSTKSGAAEPFPIALGSIPGISMQRVIPQEGVGLAQKDWIETKECESGPTESKAESEPDKENHAPRDLPKVAQRDLLKVAETDTHPAASLTEKVEAVAAVPFDGKMAKSSGKRDVATTKHVGGSGSEGPKADPQTMVTSAAAIIPQCGAAAVPPASLPARPPVALAGRTNASDEPRAVESRKIHVGEPIGHAASESSPSAGDGLPLSAAVLATGAVPPPASSHSMTGSARADAGLSGTKTVESTRGNAPQVLASGPARLDVGVFDGTHGWLRIRAELGAGGAVNASLTANASGHESLRAALPEMASYLKAEAVIVSRIAVHRTAAGSNGMGTGEGQQSGGASRQGAADGQRQNGGGSPKKNIHAMEHLATGSVTTMRGAVDMGIAVGVHAMPGLGFRLGVLGGSNGGWCARMNAQVVRARRDETEDQEGRSMQSIQQLVTGAPQVANSAASVASALAKPRAAASNNAGSTSSSTADSSATITANDFLTLLVAELKNQDPTQPTDPNAYISQMVNVNSLQQLIGINQGITSLDSAAGVSGSTKASGANTAR